MEPVGQPTKPCTQRRCGRRPAPPIGPVVTGLAVLGRGASTRTHEPTDLATVIAAPPTNTAGASRARLSRRGMAPRPDPADITSRARTASRHAEDPTGAPPAREPFGRAAPAPQGGAVIRPTRRAWALFPSSRQADAGVRPEPPGRPTSAHRQHAAPTPTSTPAKGAMPWSARRLITSHPIPGHRSRSGLAAPVFVTPSRKDT
jgi:hypothetical protein